MVLAILVVGVPGCGPDGSTFTVDNITIRDVSNLVTDASATTPPSGWDGMAGAIAGDGLTQVIVAWPGESCVESWTLTLSGFAIVIDIQPGAFISDCYGTFTTPAVLLELNRAVDASNIVVNLTAPGA